MPVLDDVVPSPCTRVCTLDDADVCLGCGRTLDEIKGWAAADPDGRRTILAQAAARRAVMPWRGGATIPQK